MNVEILFAASAISLVVFATSKKQTVMPCCGIIAQLYPHQLAGLDTMIGTGVDGRIYWEASHGLEGLWRRWQNHRGFVHICQIRAELDPNVRPAELLYVTERAATLARASFNAALWGSLRVVAPQRAAHAGLLALGIYREIAYQTHAILSDGTAHKCADALASVL